MNEEAMTRVGLQRHQKKKKTHVISKELTAFWFQIAPVH
jgi:hypothetical protein